MISNLPSSPTYIWLMKRILFVLTFFALAFPAVVLAAPAQLPPLVKSAFDAVEMSPDFAFTQTTVDGDGRKVEKFDPTRPKGHEWQLVTKNGKAPTSSELSAYAKEKAEAEKHQGKKNGKDEKKDGFSSMVRPDSLRLVSETPTEARFEFRLPAEDGDERGREIVDSLIGRLVISKNGPWLHVLELENQKPIKPITGVKIERMYTKMTFLAPAAGLPGLLGELRATVRGRAMLVKSLDQDTVTTFSEYRKVK